MEESEKMIKQEIELRRNSNNGDHWIAYEVLAGAPGNTVFFVTPVRSLADLETDYDAALRKVMSPETAQQFQSWIRQAVTGFEVNFVGINPEWSHPMQSVVAANPSFWNRQNEPAMASTPTGERKPGEVSPAGMKNEQMEETH
jgi:hypothetical protein